jgi:toxin ParE1/3/4
MEVIWFKSAIQDLILAKEYIAKDNTNAAISTVQRIRDKVNLLSDQPSIGRLGRIPNTRELVIDKTPYILPYRVRDNKIEILRVLHSSRRWPTSI